MEPTVRGVGTTRTERKLAQLADRTFLDLWSYPNTFNNRDLRNGQGKELCDLLVLCGNDLLIFSDKYIRWPSGDIKLAWSRWYRRAVKHSVEQINGAARWVRRYPDRIFIDPRCETRFPVDLPDSAALNIHGIAVVSGARAACRAYTGDNDGALMLSSFLSGVEHEDPFAKALPAFMLGDVNPAGAFVHVFDIESLTIVMRELDTITDFVAYLDARAAALRRGRVRMAASEADLLAAYLTNIDEDEGPSIPQIVPGMAYPEGIGMFPPGQYASLRQSPAYRARRDFNADSYEWDRLIGLFTKNLLAGTSVKIAGIEPKLHLAEQALRRMALERRIVRRSLAYAFLDAYFKAEQINKDKFARVVMSPADGADPECLYLFLILAYRADWMVARGYDWYRDSRGALLHAYCKVALMQYRHCAKRVVGIALDASAKMTKQRISSEDIMFLEVTEWTEALLADTRNIQRKGEVLLPSKLKPSFVRQKSLADLDEDKSYVGNRSARRAARARRRKR